MNRELPDVQSGFRKGRGTRDQIANIHWIIEKAWEFQRKKFTFYFNIKIFYAKEKIVPKYYSSSNNGFPVFGSNPFGLA